MGNWRVFGNLIDPDSDNCPACDSLTQCRNFSRVVPEPVSTALFLLGGGTLIARRFTRKKK